MKPCNCGLHARLLLVSGMMIADAYYCQHHLEVLGLPFCDSHSKSATIVLPSFLLRFDLE